MNESMELFGEERLIKIIKGKTPKSSSEIMEDIWTQVNIFRGGFEQNDDMTMVLVKVK
jgi:sigma-B regulation protein RsbU (phosphoserine phosphatase)